MEIKYSDTKYFSESELFELFNSVGWESAKYADKLALAMKGSENVVSAWDGERLIGLMTAMSDGIMTAYFHWLLVHPDYQGRNIGRDIVERMLGLYKDYKSKILISYNKQIGFYEKCGFQASGESTPMKVMGVD